MVLGGNDTSSTGAVVTLPIADEVAPTGEYKHANGTFFFTLDTAPAAAQKITAEPRTLQPMAEARGSWSCW